MDIAIILFWLAFGSVAGLRLAWLCMPPRWCLVTGHWCWMWFRQRGFHTPREQFLLC